MKKALIVALVLGYVGAALSYAPYIGGVEIPYLCPVCPHITALGDPVDKFVRFTLVLGTLNSLLFSAIAIIGVFAFRSCFINRYR